MNNSALKAAQYFSHAAISNISLLGQGLINDTFLITTEQQVFVLQRINTQVFPKPSQIMENLMLLNQQINQLPMANIKLTIPRLIPTLTNKSHAIDTENNVWRALEFIKDSMSKEIISHNDEAKQLGFALGYFHCLFKQVPLDAFHDTLPGFHITPEYFRHYQSIEKLIDNPLHSEKIIFCRDFINEFKEQINVLEDAKLKGFLKPQITHGDPKLNNFLFEKGTNRVISLIDLDTVKPGLLHHDIADCLRSCCHISDQNHFDIEIAAAILNNYLQETHRFFSDHDYHYLFPAIQLMPFELGLRFFTDYLQGNIYFKVNSPEQNLNKAIAQFKLCKNIGQQEAAIKQLIETFRSNR